MEILLSAVIFIVAVSGVFATLNAVRAPVVTKESNLVAAVFGKQVLEALRTQVTDPQGSAAKLYYQCSAGLGANPCPDFSLSVGHHEVSAANLTASTNPSLSWPGTITAVNTITCNGVANTVCLVYNVTCANGSALSTCGNTDVAHRVDLNIQS